MDDIISGKDDLEAVTDLQSQLIEMLKSAGMQLHKWKANHPLLLENVNKDITEDYSFLDTETKALGVAWNPKLDVFKFKVKIDQQEKVTKRVVLSEIAKLFDPLGLIGPVITKAKVFMQDLWKLKLDWNDPLPDSVAQSWLQFTKSLESIERLNISRWILIPHPHYIALHGFADGSSVAFGAAIYLQSSNSFNTSCHLITSKSQVAPLKTITIPRLELSACLLLSRLVVRVLKALKIDMNNVYLYTDSQIALAWIKTPPWKLKTFVSNRVAKIQDYTQNFQWNHISTNCNPADPISRGLDATELLNCDLWFHGPSFLTQHISVPEQKDAPLSSEEHSLLIKEMKDIAPESQMTDVKNPKLTKILQTNNSETESNKTVLLITDSLDVIDKLLENFNNYFKINNILSFIFRFIFNCRNKVNKKVGPLTLNEVDNAEKKLIQHAQRPLSDKKGFPSNLYNLSPFVDKEGIVRVGGRLENASVPYYHKHPAILPKGSKLSKIYFGTLHRRLLHVGPQGLLNAVRLKFWPLSGRSIARKIVRQCVVCFKSKPIPSTQIMGNLPSERVNMSSPFAVAGLDLSGPYLVKFKNQRKGILNKVYICICICFSTKAIHLELLSDLTSDAMIATLKRFTSRRGKCSKIYTDNATNFVGSNSKLKKFYNLINFPDENLANYFTCEGIDWNFIPPRSPHFGGLWEAGVKSVKHHLKRTIGNLHFTYEEFETIMIQVEGILNSRPLTPLSNDTENFDALTPGHFLIGRPITSLPEPNLTDINENRLSRWQKTTKIVQHIWQKWKLDYLNTLQSRSKWRVKKNDLKVNQMVLIKDDFLPINTWLLGRITEVYYGSDGKVRVVKIKTKSGEFKRTISKVCPLPIEDNDN